MNRFRNWLLHIDATDPEIQRRGKILVSLSIGVVIVLLTVGLALTLIQPTIGRLINLTLATLVFVASFILGKKGLVTIGGYLLIILTTIGALSGEILNPTSPFNAFYLVPSILLASILLKPFQIWVVLGLCLASIFAISQLIPPDIRTSGNLNLALAHLTVLLIVSAFISFIGAQSLASALTEANEARRRAEAANQQLAELNNSLEQRVTERTAALQRLSEEQQATLARLEESIAAQRNLQQTIASLSVPVLPVRDDTIVIPLVGAVTTDLLAHFNSTALDATERYGARTLIIDLTGIALLDTLAAATIVQTATAARLLGAETTLVGIRPEVAQTLVSLGASFTGIRTAATLQTALFAQQRGGSRPARDAPGAI
ncbi:MAG TPA: STAS domain-containing protein [Chloroflexus aurantiacus]|uniref:Sulfate transporter/antisigma-factor antagonist STAS n=1 Tax=Chloroflexus aurantiacus (strain ATCC 29366 / DSM 635 / J-10-fl) TaxID=324602 RepID=A9WI31_CHLAA|nr:MULTISPECIES: STAS domain-containing protein [Chloroflexus]ABY35722.1 Sulfate transporter/antisigma-factor antagonist STAS [Chloroflexus aurantiacus J-10-fl]RMG49974.1 MAG: STAS domain-containing protein [Chloroflexota bacterium]GIV91821.1 MAG: anti-sigma factor antagonist [Chloroflexus sp.]HBW67018.1 STAS domain-containing protein [Chloroflexus aurantiacus]